MRRANLLFVTTGLGMGGAEKMLVKLLQRLNRNVFQPKVLVLSAPGHFSQMISKIGVPLEHLCLRAFRSAPAALGKLRAVAREPVDIVQGWMYHGNVASHLIRWFARKPPATVTGVRASLMPWREMPLSTAIAIRADARLSHYADQVIFNSKVAFEEHLALGYDARRSCVIPNGFDIKELTPDSAMRQCLRTTLGIANDDVLIGTLARFHPQKDFGTLFLALAQVLAADSRVRVVLAGTRVDAGNSEITALARHAGILDKLVLLGPRDDIQAILNGLDIFCLSSAFGEGFSNAIGEAMSCGVPCVVTDVGDSRWIVGDTGEVVPPRNPAALADALLRLVRLGREGRSKMGLSARERIAEMFSLQSVVALYEATYQMILDRRIRDL